MTRSWEKVRGAFIASLDAQTAIRLKSTVSAAVDYSLYILTLVGFASAGSIPYSAVWTLACVAVVINIVFIGSQWSGLTRHLKDPSITWPQTCSACGINFLGLVIAPQIAPVYLVNLFVPLCYGGLYFSRREFLALWFLLSLTLGVIMLSVEIPPESFSIPSWNNEAQFLLWIAVTLAIGRFLAINAEVSRLRERLHRKNKELTTATNQLAELACHDDLTGLVNRREYMRLLDTEFHRCNRTGECFSVAIIDADHFKAVNDNLGHLIGDAVLSELARLLNTHCRAEETIARYGGEEFALLLIACDNRATESALERLRRAIENHDWGRIAPGLHVTISAGAAVWRRDETIAQLLNRADSALYAAKGAGRNRVRVADC